MNRMRITFTMDPRCCQPPTLHTTLRAYYTWRNLIDMTSRQGLRVEIANIIVTSVTLLVHHGRP